MQLSLWAFSINGCTIISRPDPPGPFPISPARHWGTPPKPHRFHGASLKADQPTVTTDFDARPTQGQVTSQTAAAENALKGSSPALLDTPDEIAAALDDNENAYQTLMALVTARQADLVTPSATRISLLSGTAVRNREE